MLNTSNQTMQSMIIVVALLIVVALTGCSSPESGQVQAIDVQPTLVARVIPTLVPSAAPAALELATIAPTAQGNVAVSIETREPTAAPTLAPGARLSVPRLGIDVPVESASWQVETIDGEPVAVWDTPSHAAGHHTGSALPGQSGNCVISGHSRSDEGAIFYGLWDLVDGDQIVVQDETGQQYRYIVRQSETVHELGQELSVRQENAIQYMGPSTDRRLTLITCWPDWAYTHRLVVVALASD